MAEVASRPALSESSDDDFDYGGVDADDDVVFGVAVGDDGGAGLGDEDEDLDSALRSLKRMSAAVRGVGSHRVSVLSGANSPEVRAAIAAAGAATAEGSAAAAATAAAAAKKEQQVRQTQIDDYVRSFLIQSKMLRTLDAFNTEWYELQSKGLIAPDEMTEVPAIYVENLNLTEEIKLAKLEMDEMSRTTKKAEGTWDKFRKERNFHRMHHKRVVQEKKRLVQDIRRLKKQNASGAPTLKLLREKYESSVKDKMLMRLERDRNQAKVDSLVVSLQLVTGDGMELGGGGAGGTRGGGRGGTRATSRSKTAKTRGGGAGGGAPGPGSLRTAAANAAAAPPAPALIQPRAVPNPFADVGFEPSSLASYSQKSTFKGHTAPVCAVAFHPRKAILATGSDDGTWKMWSLPEGKLVMSGEGHRDWVGGLDFHPSGTSLASGSGDGDVRIWDFRRANCTAVLKGHSQAVWAVAHHHSGDFLVSASMDHSAKLWDLTTARARLSLRGRVDAVNHVCFRPFSNTVCTASGDKTASLWDVRSGLCTQTFYGHANAVNHCAFDVTGDTVLTCDADGVVKTWDARMMAQTGHISSGAHSAHCASFDRSGTRIVVGSDDAIVRAYSVESAVAAFASGDLGAAKPIAMLKGHSDAVQALAFDPNGNSLVTGGSDCTFRVWSG